MKHANGVLRYGKEGKAGRRRVVAAADRAG